MEIIQYLVVVVKELSHWIVLLAEDFDFDLEFIYFVY
jgi:hypothetical protein